MTRGLGRTCTREERHPDLRKKSRTNAEMKDRRLTYFIRHWGKGGDTPKEALGKRLRTPKAMKTLNSRGLNGGMNSTLWERGFIRRRLVSLLSQSRQVSL